MSVENTFQFDKIRHLDLPAPVCVEQNDTLAHTLNRMREARANCVLVCDGKHLCGVFTTRDALKKVIATDVDTSRKISDFMTSSPTTTNLEASIAEAIQQMDSLGVRHLPLVNEQGEVQGLISSEDIVHYLVEHFPTEIYNLPPRLQQKIMTPEGA
jgi:CBS domain-containing protein